jgi:hypothetical protein
MKKETGFTQFCKCPKCGDRVIILELNKLKSRRVSGFESYIGCVDARECGWELFSKTPIRDIILHTAECELKRTVVDFSRFEQEA